MKRIPHEPRLFGRPRLLASLGLLLLPALAGHAQSAPTKYFRVTQGRTVVLAIPLTAADCATPHSFRLGLDKQSFVQLAGPPEVRLHTAPVQVQLRVDTTGVKTGRESVGMSINCLDCGGDRRCVQNERRLIIDITVTPALAVGTDPPAAIKAALTLELTSLLEELDSHIGGLRKYEGAADRGRKVVGYDAARVENLVEEMKRELRRIFGGKRLFAMRDYVDIKFQPPALEKISITTEGRRASLPPAGLSSAYATGFRAGWRPRGQVLVVPAASANAAFKYLRGFIGYATDHSDPKTLRVRSRPDEANVLLVTSEGEPTNTVTNHDLPHFWPGLYRLKVSKPGFKTIDQGLVDFTLYDSIDCDLKTDDPIPCKLS